MAGVAIQEGLNAVVVTYNEALNIGDCIQSIIALNYSAKLVGILIVDGWLTPGFYITHWCYSLGMFWQLTSLKKTM